MILCLYYRIRQILVNGFLSKANINFDVEQVVEELEYVDPEWQEEANKNPNAYAEKIVDKLRAKGWAFNSVYKVIDISGEN